MDFGNRADGASTRPADPAAVLGDGDRRGDSLDGFRIGLVERLEKLARIS